MDWPRRGRRDDAFESGGAMTANIELVTGRNTLQRLPRLPGAAAEELDRVLAHDPLDPRDVWAQALPQPAPRELYTLGARSRATLGTSDSYASFTIGS